MPNQINRDIYVLSNKIKNPVDYVQGTDALDIVFNFRDFEIPDSSSAQVFVSKPSGKGVYNTAVIAGNAVTVSTTPEMFSEVGNTELQINIRNNGELLTSFIQPVVVQKNLSFHGESGNESDFFEEYIGKIDTAISEADTATDSANAAASDANSAASNANDAAEDIRQKAESGEFSATVKVGTVTASKPGGDAEVTNTGTAQDAVFNFVLPRGEQGPKGDKGDKGDTGAIENIDGVSVDFSPSSTRQNIATGDTFSTLFGKIAKWFSDLGTAAFQGVSNVLTQTAAGYVLDARQGKVLNDNMGSLSGLSTSAKNNLVSAINEINTGLSELNTDYYNDSKKQTIPDRTMTEVYGFQLQPGTYLLSCSAFGHLSDADAGFVLACIIPGFTNTVARGILRDGGGLCCSKIFKITTDTDVSVQITHTHGSSIEFTAEVSYIRFR